MQIRHQLAEHSAYVETEGGYLLSKLAGQIGQLSQTERAIHNWTVQCLQGQFGQKQLSEVWIHWCVAVADWLIQPASSDKLHGWCPEMDKESLWLLQLQIILM